MVTHAKDILAYQETVAWVKEWVTNHEDTILIATSDHETGGLVLNRTPLDNTHGDPIYDYFPEKLLTGQRNSTIVLAQVIVDYYNKIKKGT